MRCWTISFGNCRVEQQRQAGLWFAASDRGLGKIPEPGVHRRAAFYQQLDAPLRSRTRRQLWTYCGLGVVTSSSADHELENGQLRRRKKRAETRGLNVNYNPDTRFKAVKVRHHNTITLVMLASPVDASRLEVRYL
jgi:transposase